MKRSLPKLPKGLQLALVLTALLFLALSYWQFLGCPRLSAARELRRMERDYQYEQTALTALLPQKEDRHLAIGLSENRLHVTLLQKNGLWWRGKTDKRNGLLSLKAGAEPALTFLPWGMPDSKEEPDLHWAALLYAPGTQAADGRVTLTVDNDGAQQWTFSGNPCWQQDDLYLFLLEVDDHIISWHVLEMDLCRYLFGYPDPSSYGISLEAVLYDDSGAPQSPVYKEYTTRN